MPSAQLLKESLSKKRTSRLHGRCPFGNMCFRCGQGSKRRQNFRAIKYRREEQIRAVAKKGGVLGVTFYFMSYGGEQGSIEILPDAIEYFVKVASPDHVGKGSDFDGYSGELIGMSSCEDMINITRGLVQRGYSDTDIEKILGRNFMRVFQGITG